MKLTEQIKFEELMMFVASIILFYWGDFAWWWYPLLILAPDISMLGYLVNTKVGAFTYNIFHNKGIALIIELIGLYYLNDYFIVAGLILFGHASMDRILGYGLKFEDAFQHTHLGWIGNKKEHQEIKSDS